MPQMPQMPPMSEFFIENLLIRIHYIIEMVLADRLCAMGVRVPFSMQPNIFLHITQRLGGVPLSAGRCQWLQWLSRWSKWLKCLARWRRWLQLLSRAPRATGAVLSLGDGHPV